MPAHLNDALIEALDAAAFAAPELPVDVVERLRGAVASCTEQQGGTTT
jgi:hypothetical protein